MVNNIPATIQAALAKHQAGELIVAEQMYRQLLSVMSNDAGILNLLGVALFQQNKLSEAKVELLKAINLNRSDPSFYFNLGIVAKAQGDSRQAEESYRNAIKLKPSYPEATQNLCNLFEEQERYEEARFLYHKAIQANSQDIKVQFKFALLCKKLGDWKSVIESCQKVLASQTENFEARYLYAHALQVMGQADLAIAQYQAILKNDPQQAYAHFCLSQLLAKRGEMNVALVHAKTAAKLDSTRDEIQLNYASLRLIEHIEPAAFQPNSFGQDIGLAQAVHAILNDCYANEASLRGWLFFTQIDYRFFESQLTRYPIQRRVTQWQSYSESIDVNQAAAEHLARISQIEDVSAQNAALEELTLLNTPSLTQDSFAGLAERECEQAVTQFISGEKLNLVIVGAGPIGLVLASAFKVALGNNVNVLLVENRVSSLHHKLPYERRWITNIPHRLLKGLVDKTLSDIFAKIGDGHYIGCTINILESLLLLSCRQMGVKFLFTDKPDFAFLQNSNVQLIFDASGNRFQQISWPDSSDKIAVRHNIKTDLLRSNDAQISLYGIKALVSQDNDQVTLGSYNNLLFPLHKNQPIKLAMLKLIHIPARLYEVLMSYVTQHNVDNKYFVWPGNLQVAINQIIVIINLNKIEYDYLCKQCIFPMSLAEAMQVEVLNTSLDERTIAIFKLLASNTTEDDRVDIDAPFLCEPYLVNRDASEQLFGKPLMRVGDSIYNGNAKLGNGLGLHLSHVRHIQTVLKIYAR
jgi:Flp pilus assembly protein TadD